MNESKSPFGKYFQIKNKDPDNVVLYKNFYFYSILGVYLFYFWYLFSVLINFNTLKNDNRGTFIYVNAIISLIGTLLVLLLAIYNKTKYPYELSGIVFIIYISGLATTLYIYEKLELDGRYERDPVSLGITFLLVYSFVSYFYC